eukprot:SAG11_NODE_36149_length_263_cov_0.628049_1_plen_27_part_01
MLCGLLDLRLGSGLALIPARFDSATLE